MPPSVRIMRSDAVVKRGESGAERTEARRGGGGPLTELCQAWPADQAHRERAFEARLPRASASSRNNTGSSKSGGSKSSPRMRPVAAAANGGLRSLAREHGAPRRWRMHAGLGAEVPAVLPPVDAHKLSATTSRCRTARSGCWPSGIADGRTTARTSAARRTRADSEARHEHDRKKSFHTDRRGIFGMNFSLAPAKNNGVWRRGIKHAGCRIT